MGLKAAYVVPSRGRPENVKRLVQACKKTDFRSDLWIVIDDNDWKRREYEAIANEFDVGYIIVENYSGGMCKSLNAALELLMDDTKYDYYDYFGFLGDDVLPKTIFWDYMMQLAIPFPKNGISYGNDLFQQENLPTHPLMTRSIIDHLGGMTPPGLLHLYADNFWKSLGRDINGLYYKPEIILEHLHPIAQKSAMDEGYARVNGLEIYEHDLRVYEDYIASEDYRRLVAILKNP